MILTHDDIAAFIHEHYYVTRDLRIRLGQAFCNKYLENGRCWPELFYETNTDKINTALWNCVGVDTAELGYHVDTVTGLPIGPVRITKRYKKDNND